MYLEVHCRRAKSQQQGGREGPFTLQPHLLAELVLFGSSWHLRRRRRLLLALGDDVVFSVPSFASSGTSQAGVGTQRGGGFVKPVRWFVAREHKIIIIIILGRRQLQSSSRTRGAEKRAIA